MITSSSKNNTSSEILASFDDPSLFTKWVDPKSGVESYILTARVAPLQQSFYYVNSSITDDGRYYWFYCGFPPSGSANNGRTLAFVDFHEGKVCYCPETQFSHASPFVDAVTGCAYWCNETGIWKREPKAEAKPELVNSYDTDFVKKQRVWRYATHLTLSADRTHFQIDGEIGNQWYAGRAPLDGGKIEIWQIFDRSYNHGQFHPVDPDLILLAQDFYVDRIHWEYHPYENRLWLIRKGEKARPVYEKSPGDYVGVRQDGHLVNGRPRQVRDCRAMHSHEWWSGDGRYIWYVHHGPGHGIERVLLGGSEPELVWPHDTISHAHSDATDHFLVGDSQPPQDPSDRRVTFRNIKTEREVNLVSFMPDMAGDELRYHIHCHPRFCLSDRLICYTTTVLGQVDVAFAKVEDLIARTL